MAFPNPRPLRVRPRTPSRSSIHQHSPTASSFNHDLHDIAALSSREERISPARGGASLYRASPPSHRHGGRSGSISCHNPKPATYIATFEPLAPAISRTPTYERGALKIMNAGSADRSSPSSSGRSSLPARLPRNGKSPRVWFTREDLLPEARRSLQFIPDPRDDLFAPTGESSQKTERVHMALPKGPRPDRIRRRPDRASPTRVGSSRDRPSLAGIFGDERVDKGYLERTGRVERGTSLPTLGQSSPPRRVGSEVRPTERFANTVLGGINKWYKRVTRGGGGRS